MAEGDEFEFRPSRTENIINGSVSFVFFCWGLVIAIGAPELLGLGIGLVFAVPCLILFLRSFFVGVLVQDERIRVRGYLWSRTVARDDIVEIDSSLENPRIFWIARQGLQRITPLAMLAVRRSSVIAASSVTLKESFLRKLEHWAGQDGEIVEVDPLPSNFGFRKQYREQADGVVRRQDSVVSFIEWASLPLAIFVVVFAIGGRGANASSLDASSVGVGVLAVVMIFSRIVILIRVSRLTQLSLMDGRGIWVCISGIAAALGILLIRAAIAGELPRETIGAVGFGVAGIVFFGLVLLVMRRSREDS